MNKQNLRLILLVLFMLSLNLSIGFVQVKAATQIIEIKATQDAQVCEDYPDTNYGTNNFIRIYHTLPREDGFLYFDISSITGQNYSSVMLKFYIYGSTVTTLQVFPVEQSWNEDTITWNNVPDVNMSIMCSQSFPVKLGFSYVNVTSIVSNWTSGIIPNFGFYLRTTINGINFYCKEHSNEAYHPTLEFTVPAEDNSPSIPSIAGFEVIITLFGMLGVIFTLIFSRRQKLRYNISK